jgi:hypothetical protein
MSNAAIAGALVVTKRAVERHVDAIFLKLGLRDADNVAVASRPRWSAWPTRGEPRGRSESGDGGGLHADVGLRTACRPKAGREGYIGEVNLGGIRCSLHSQSSC